MNLSSSHTRTIVIASIGLAIAIAVAIGLVLFFRTNSSTLASHISSERTMAYVRTADRAELLRWVIRLENLDEGPDAASIPSGDLYELAYLKKTSENGWVLFVHNRATGSYETRASDTDASLLLTPEQANESLLRTPFFAQHVSPMDVEVIWIRPEALPMTSEAAAHALQASLFGGTQILLLPEGQGRGTLIIDGKSARSGRRAPSVLRRAPNDLLWISAVNIGELATQFDAGLSAMDADLATGLRGITASWVASKNLEGLPALWKDPLSLAVRQMSGSTVAVLAAGSLRTATEVKLLEETLAAKGAQGTVRQLPLVENMRNDVIADLDRVTEVIGTWTLTHLGGSPDLFFTTRGEEFVVSTDKGTLEAVLAESATTSNAPNELVELSFDVDYLSQKFSSSLPFLGDPLTQAFQQLFGLGVRKIDLTATSLSPVMVFHWTLTARTADSGMQP